MRCDTCGKEVKEVRRVVVDSGYDRTLAKPLYNCPECYAKKEQTKLKNKPFDSAQGMPKPGMSNA